MAPPIIIYDPPPPRPPRDILIVGARPKPVAEEPAAAEPEAPPLAAGEPAAPAPAPSAALNPDVTHARFDDPGRDRHPVPDRGPVTQSSFDDDDRINRHPVP